MIIGLTGLTGAGKSTAAKLLREKGFHVIDADKIGHRVTEQKEILDKIRAAFGDEVILPDAGLNRKALGKMVFSDAEKLKKLNAITHPAIKERIMSEAEAHKDKTVVIDGALIKECGLAQCCDAVLRITAPKEIRKQRIMARDAMTEAEAENRMNSQVEHSDAWIDIDNSSTVEELEDRLTEALCRIK